MRRLKIEREALRLLIEDEKLTHAQAGARLGASQCWVERACKRLGIKTQRTGPRDGAKHTNWKGGRILVGRYWYVWAKGHPNATKQNRIAEHRLVMSNALGRPLRKGEVVHHIDGDPQNNVLSNLQLFAANGLHLEVDLAGRCPKWSGPGKAAIAEATRQRHIRQGHQVCDDSEHTQKIARLLATA